MKISLDCYPCFLRQALQAGRHVTADETRLKAVLDAVAGEIPRIPPGAASPVIGGIVHRIVREIAGDDDPYRRVKAENLAEARRHYPAMKDHVARSENPMAEAAHLAIAGNIIDSAVIPECDIEREIFSLADRPLAVDDTQRLCEALDGASSVLYIGDNVGETVFDRVFIEEITAPVTYVVRDRPVLNDVTVQDALDSGLGGLARILPSGSASPGAVLPECSDEFLDLFEKADVVVSKGQGNYEALSDAPRPIFFLLRAKCPVVARDLGVEVGSLVLRESHRDSDRSQPFFG